ncbi:UDP-glucuronate:xylan alpha-glucuronosyltransferase 2-like [Ananas comosus]|uniref:Hexosyltransferase n=1 Tax=Ananas comosus TaxID=4615 RepID=A0A6P5G6L2_ANACO|nr:UDP-glucuronate:xylan alpha-glucuronosyltransferase 2-like [Ananas comosus]
MGSSLMEMHKAAPSKGAAVKINITFFVLVLVISVDLLIFYSMGLFNSNGVSVTWCTLSEHCSARKDGMKLKLEYENSQVEERVPNNMIREGTTEKEKKLSFFESLRAGHERIGLVNIGKNESVEIGIDKNVTVVEFERVPDNLKWTDLFPSSIDEENGRSVCPEIPMPVFSAYEEMDVVVAKVPCQSPKPGWYRDVFRLQVHLVAANLVVRKARRDGRGTAKVALVSECEPMRELFRCDDLVEREGEWWMYQVQVDKLAEKVSLPWGACKVALQLPEQQAINGESNVSSIASLASPRQRREAYATIIHSSDDYVCGAVMLAHCLRNTGSTGDRDLVLLHDDSISRPKLQALAAAGWTLRRIERIHNPRAKRGAYNEYNFSKFRLWQLTEYDKIVFVDTDILILRSLDHLFRLPQISAVHDSGVLFNSGVMVIEPSNCTFNALVAHRDDIISYNGGDQGFLNEMFAWWHRLPKRLNHFKMAWKNATEEREWMGRLFAAETPELHGIHYFGVKPWRCYRDYDCNWDVERLRMYASDEFHRAWWQRYDEIDEGLQWLCGLTAERIDTLEAERRTAATMRFSDEHWKINITDKRRFVTVE